jgi:hypothetical protein
VGSTPTPTPRPHRSSGGTGGGQGAPSRPAATSQTSLPGAAGQSAAPAAGAGACGICAGAGNGFTGGVSLPTPLALGLTDLQPVPQPDGQAGASRIGGTEPNTLGVPFGSGAGGFVGSGGGYPTALGGGGGFPAGILAGALLIAAGVSLLAYRRGLIRLH